jgi:hypothetical protein
VRRQLVDSLLAGLATRCEIFTCVLDLIAESFRFDSFTINGPLTNPMHLICPINQSVPYYGCENYTRKNITFCSKSANKPSTSCVRTACQQV